MYVCMYVCMSACMYVCMYVCASACMYIYVDVFNAKLIVHRVGGRIPDGDLRHQGGASAALCAGPQL